MRKLLTCENISFIQQLYIFFSPFRVIFRNPCFVFAGENVIDPIPMRKIPRHRTAKSFVERNFTPPAEFGFDFRAVDRVAEVVSGAVFYVDDRLFNVGDVFMQFARRKLDELLQQFDILQFVFSADIVFLS